MNATSTEETIDRLYYSIGEVSQELGLRSSNVRFWCSYFEIKPRRSRLKNNRQFSEDEFRMLRKVKELHDSGNYKLAGIKWVLESELRRLKK